MRLAPRAVFSGTKTQEEASFLPSNQLTFTHENGVAAPSPYAVNRVGVDGPLLFTSPHIFDDLAHFNRERIPERVVHAVGAGAHGTFEVTTDFAEKYSMSPAFKKGSSHSITARFSTVGSARGGPDVARDPRGFAIKIRTKDNGILDWVFNNTPVFFIRDPLKFPAFIHTQKTNPQTNQRDPDMVFDYLWQNPEASLQFLRLFSDLGTPFGFRHMHGWSGHTYRLVQQDGSWVHVKVKLESDQGVKNFTGPQANYIAGQNQMWATQDLFEAIERSEHPSWTVKFAVKTIEEGRQYKYNVNDLTKDWMDAQWHEVGKMTLTQNVENYFAEIEQVHFSPSNAIEGWAPSNDPVLQSRLFSYNDAARHRLGANYLQIPVNCPLSQTAHFQRDGKIAVHGNQGKRALYPSSTDPLKYVKSYVYPKEDLDEKKVVSFESQMQELDYDQPRAFYQELAEHDKVNIAANFGGTMAHMKNTNAQNECIKLFEKIDARLGKDVAAAIAEAKKQPPIDGVKDPSEIAVPGGPAQTPGSGQSGTSTVPTSDAGGNGSPPNTAAPKDGDSQPTTGQGSPPAKTSKGVDSGAQGNAEPQKAGSGTNTPPKKVDAPKGEVGNTTPTTSATTDKSKGGNGTSNEKPNVASSQDGSTAHEASP
ncbi:catalase-domain-containing protein [Ceraceosorus guamensis]|uniref:Catalase-domain-containing protein n=1 Tax=Ceraceosorus guamensis TaxID=1522189 RepID=A0A316W2T8_9BASI|nr:catalase-domain-containing protein [Ceraceosorus guamensis]PWN44100.1 catalase-domain-containing protein [Ceraceosorus guamensis]